MRAGVITANIIWKAMKRQRGMCRGKGAGRAAHAAEHEVAKAADDAAWSGPKAERVADDDPKDADDSDGDVGLGHRGDSTFFCPTSPP